MDNKEKNSHVGMMAPLHHPQTVLGPLPGFQRTLPPPHGQPHGLPASIHHTSAYQYREQPYSPPGPFLPSNFHRPYPPPPDQLFTQSQSRKLPQSPLDDPYLRLNSLRAPAPSHSVSESHSSRSYTNSAQPEPIPHSAPPHYGQIRQRVMLNGGIVRGRPLQRKPVRAQLACDQCRARKTRCDEGRPACSHCRANSTECIYKEASQRQETPDQMILKCVQECERKMNVKMTGVEKLMQYLISQSGFSLPVDAPPRISHEDLPQKATMNRTTTPNALLESKPPTPVALELSRADSNKTPDMNLLSYINTVQNMQTQPLPKVQNHERDGELSVPQNHTTAAHKLLRWESIRRLLSCDIHPDYVLRNERKRGLIRIYGCGEGIGRDTEYYLRQGPAYLRSPPPQAQGLPSSSAIPATNTSTPRVHEEYSQANSPNWGYGLPMPPQGRGRVKEHPGGLDPSGHLNTHPDVVRRLVHSYMSNIHILHPFMDATMLAQKVEVFIQQYTPPRSANKGRGMKRKRSAEHMHIEAPEISPSPILGLEKWPLHRIEHSVDNAIILMVLALGAICEHKTALPSFAPDPNKRPRAKREFVSSLEVQAVSNDIWSLTPPGPASRLNTQAFDTPDFLSPDPAWEWKNPSQWPHSGYGLENKDKNEACWPKNIDVIPGLAYYAYAAGILGEMQGGCELPFIQASILASFYAGQLAHPFQSHGWICQAARACSFLIRAIDYHNIPKKTTFAPKELCEFAYWTCLQHESDLLAELDLTAGDVSQSKTKIELPTGYLSMTEAPVMFYYSAQIHLRKLLNQIHQSLYNTKIEHLPDKIVSAFSVSLDDWKQNLPDSMQWQEGDEPSDDINTARLRAKYYGARYIIYRPVLERALHSKSPRVEGKGKEKTENDAKLSVSFKTHDFQAPSMTRSSSKREMRPNCREIDNPSDSIHYDELDDKTRRACDQCITAAIQSTKAFHNIKGRPIVTNIFGTAHAQFGNMLVLSATYMSNLSQMVDADELEHLLKRTIKFLTMYKDISPTLGTDAEILSDIYYKIFKEQASFTMNSFGNA